MLVSAFITHKKAERFKDCQDRFSVNPDTKSIAVSDGMSQSIFQKYWAQILSEKYTSAADWVPNRESVRELSPIWYDKVNSYLDDEEKAGRNPWRAKGSIARGLSAGATIVGVRFNNDEWVCDVLGDSCFILVRESHIEKLITSEDVEAFDSYPDFYDSNPKKIGKGTLKTETGKLLPGDMILLVSDPFSDFLLKNKGTGNESVLVDRLSGVNSHEEFETVVAEWRDLGMHNDDSTLVIIKQDKSEELNLIDGCIDDIDELIANEETIEEESFETKIEEVQTMEHSSDNDLENESMSEKEEARITVSQLESSQFNDYMQESMVSTLKEYKTKKGSWEKKAPSIWEEIKTVIVKYITKE